MRGQVANPRGKPRGAKDRLPRNTLRRLMAAYVAGYPSRITDALNRCVTGKAPDKVLAVMLKAEGERYELTGAGGRPVHVHHHFPTSA